MSIAASSAFEIESFYTGDAEYRVVERTGERTFNIVRAARGEPLELLAECPYSYNREGARARAIRLAEVLRDEDVF